MSHIIERNRNSWWFYVDSKIQIILKKSNLITKIEVHYELPYPDRGVWWTRGGVEGEWSFLLMTIINN